jgi:hypothetical protein
MKLSDRPCKFDLDEIAWRLHHAKVSEGYDTNIIPVIKWVREFYGTSLKEAVGIVRSVSSKKNDINLYHDGCLNKHIAQISGFFVHKGRLEC